MLCPSELHAARIRRVSNFRPWQEGGACAVLSGAPGRPHSKAAGGNLAMAHEFAATQSAQLGLLLQKHDMYVLLIPLLTPWLPAQPVLRAETLGGSARPAALSIHQTPAADTKAEYEKRKKEAEGSVEKLWKLYEWCDAYALKNESRSTLRAILKLDEGDRKAHELLGHIEYEGKWYDNAKKVEEYKAKKLEADAKASGKVVYKGALVDPADVPFLQKGMIKDATGKWFDAETQKKMAEGWQLQDLTWIPPAEAENIAKGMWKCGAKWLSLDDANKYHSEVGRWWVIANERFILYSTCTRKVSELALENCERAYRELMRVYGTQPTQAVPVIVLNSIDQYGLFARGEAGTQQPEARGLSSAHGAFMAEAYVEFLGTGQTLPGVAYWDGSSDAGNRFGEMFVRHAAAQSFAEALDQSPKAVAKLTKGEGAESYPEAFWAEKQIPAWFRYGAATYVERYFLDLTVAVGGNSAWRREWSVTNITGKGGLDPLDRIFKFEIDVDNPNSGKLINEAGLLVAFALDGKCVEVQAKLGALKDAIKNNKDISKAGLALAEEIKKNEAKLRTFAAL